MYKRQDVARKIEKLHIIFELSDIKQGDKIAVCGRNSSHWGVTFLARQVIAKIIRSGGFFIVIKAIKNINNI